MSAAAAARSPRLPALEGVLALGYFAAYVAYLFVRPEPEFLHWVSLVFVPFALLTAVRRAAQGRPAAVLASLGLRRGALGSGLGWGIAIGLAVSVLQVAISRYAPQILELIRNGRALYLFPASFLLMLLTAGFTEEFFFRGVLQTRLESLLHSRLLAVIATALLFGLYHLPYAYMNPRWPSAGDWSASFFAAFGQAVPAGLVLGGLFYLARRNLLACVVAHSLINALPAMTMIRFGGR